MSRIIKRYENRKLYDTGERRYISLEEIAALIRDGVDVKVIDRTSAKDITTQTLTQIIFEEGKLGRNPFSTETLHGVIRWGSSVIDEGIHQAKRSLDDIVPKSLSKLFGVSHPGQIRELIQRVESLESAIDKLAGSAGKSVEPNRESKPDSK